ncbi:MAG: hypothetical protein WBO39_04290 [Ferruginibacter sp.]
MYRNKKTPTAFLLLLLLAIPLFFSVTLLVKQQVMQYQRNERFNKEKLQTISVLSAKIFWVKPGKEILYDGKLFDVKTFKTEDNKITLTGFFDHKEDKLVQHIIKLAAKRNQSGSPLSQTAITCIFFPVFASTAEITAADVYWKLIPKHYYIYDEMLPAAPADVPIHPPGKYTTIFI